ncbi:hypothetical protein Q5752_004894 [Cryptotrichosporon argae]
MSATDPGTTVGDTGDACGVNPTDRLGLRIGAIFVILATSMCGTLFPILTRRMRGMREHVPGCVFEFSKFFGSGVILATSLIHLLEPAADDELGAGNTISAGGCISDAWADYPYAFGICLASLFATFVIELIAFRLGSGYLAARGGLALNAGQAHLATGYSHVDGTHSGHDPAGRSVGAGVGHTHPHPGGHDGAPCRASAAAELEPAHMGKKTDADEASEREVYTHASEQSPAAAQFLGVLILEFGVVFHSIIIGLTLALASPDEFTTLFIVIIFHQTFEGLGLGTRLAFLKLPRAWGWAPIAAALLYALMTPVGMAIGLGTRESTSMTSAAASIASGVLDSISAGILIYTATVELIAHEFIFNSYYHTCSWRKLTFVLVSFALGAGIMALLGKWA